MDDIGAIIFLIIFAVSLIGSLIQKLTGTGQPDESDEERPQRPRASDLPAATRRQIYGTGSPRAAEADEDDGGEPVAPIPVQNLWQQRQQQHQRQAARSTAEAPPQRQQPERPRKEAETFRAREQAPWRAADKAPGPEAAQQASAEAAERARRQREAQRQRARQTAQGGGITKDAAAGVARLAEPKERLASNEERMRVQKRKMAEALKKRDEARSMVSSGQRQADFRSAPVKRKPRRSAQLTQLGRLMRNERAIRTGIIFSEILGKPKALREDMSHPAK
jgi:hypothetical protein